MTENKVNKNKINIFLIGDSKTGKTSIIKTLLGFPFLEEMITTIGFDNYITEIELKNKKKINLQIYDTAGQEKYRSIAFQLLKTKCEGIVFIYSIDDENSFNSIFEYWINEINNNIINISNYPIYIIGNKSDLKDDRAIKYEEGKKKAEEYKFKFMETSAKTGLNIKELFTNITQDIYDSFYILENEEIKKKNESNNIEINTNVKPKKCFVLKAYGYVKKKIKKLFGLEKEKNKN